MRRPMSKTNRPGSMTRMPRSKTKMPTRGPTRPRLGISKPRPRTRPKGPIRSRMARTRGSTTGPLLAHYRRGLSQPCQPTSRCPAAPPAAAKAVPESSQSCRHFLEQGHPGPIQSASCCLDDLFQGRLQGARLHRKRVALQALATPVAEVPRSTRDQPFAWAWSFRTPFPVPQAKHCGQIPPCPLPARPLCISTCALYWLRHHSGDAC